MKARPVIAERFYGTVDGGKPRLDNVRLFNAYLLKLNGLRFELILGPIPNKRSDRQLRYVQRTVRLFSQFLGMDHDATRHAICGKLFGWVPSPLEDGHQVPAKTLRSMTVEETSELIDYLPVLGMELGLNIPLPSEDER